MGVGVVVLVGVVGEGWVGVGVCGVVAVVVLMLVMRLVVSVVGVAGRGIDVLGWPVLTSRSPECMLHGMG